MVSLSSPSTTFPGLSALSQWHRRTGQGWWTPGGQFKGELWFLFLSEKFPHIKVGMHPPPCPGLALLSLKLLTDSPAWKKMEPTGHPSVIFSFPPTIWSCITPLTSALCLGVLYYAKCETQFSASRTLGCAEGERVQDKSSVWNAEITRNCMINCPHQKVNRKYQGKEIKEKFKLFFFET